MTVGYLPAGLHLHPQRLREALRAAIVAARPQARQVVVLLGECFPDADDFCRGHEAIRVPGRHCFELLLGPDRFQRLLEESAGTFFLERELIESFEECCREPLELDDPCLRSQYFRHYQRVVVIHQPGDPDLRTRAQEVAELLGLPLRWEESDYTELDRRLESALRKP